MKDVNINHLRSSKILGMVKAEQLTISEGSSMALSADFSSEIMAARKQWPICSKCPKKKTNKTELVN